MCLLRRPLSILLLVCLFGGAVTADAGAKSRRCHASHATCAKRAEQAKARAKAKAKAKRAAARRAAARRAAAKRAAARRVAATRAAAKRAKAKRDVAKPKPQPKIATRVTVVSHPAPKPATPSPKPVASAPKPTTVAAPTTPAATSGSGVHRLFASNSVWNAPLGSNAPLDSRSPQLMSSFAAEIAKEVKAGTGPWISETSYSTPFYEVGAAQPRVPVKLDTGSWAAPLQAVLNLGVPIPADAKPAAGTDGHLTIYQPSTDTLWEFWRASKQADGWHAGWGGAMQHVSTSPGYYSDSSWPGLLGLQGTNWGSTATSLPMIAGTIMVDELKRGEIDHALALDIPDVCSGSFAFPAQRTDGGSKAADCLPEGAHLRIDPSVDLSKISMPPITRVLAVAAQKYGIVVRDVTHHATGFYAEDPTRTGANPYAGPTGLYGGLKPWNFLPKFPWGNLQLTRMTVCTAAPCRDGS